MSHKATVYFGCVLLIWIAAACADKGMTPAEQMEIKRLDLAFEADSVPDYMENGKNLYLSVMGEIAGREMTVGEIAGSKATAMFGDAVNRRLGLLDSVQYCLGEAFGTVRHILPQVPVPEVYGVILPVAQSVVTSDSTVLVGLNHYLGADFEGYRVFPDYIRNRKVRERIPVDIAEAYLASRFPFTPGETETSLNHILYEGALLHTLEVLFPGKGIAGLLSVTPEQELWLKENLRNVYHRILEQQLLFSSDPSVAAKLLNPSAGTFIVSRDAPPMAGRYVGLMIVRDYLDRNPETAPVFLLTPEFYNSSETLAKSGFNP